MFCLLVSLIVISELKMKLSIVLLFCLSITKLSAICPENDLIKPCVCEDDDITCETRGPLDLDTIFGNLEKYLSEDEKRFTSLTLKNKAITELKENQFRDITFGSINIQNCKNLKTIHSNAFDNTLLNMTYFYSDVLPLLTEGSSIFKILSKFRDIQGVYLLDTQIETIPTNAFEGNLSLLTEIDFWGTSFKVVEDNAFSSLTKLQALSFTKTSIEAIPQMAFHFNEDSNLRLNISFVSNPHINSSSFASNVLLNINRPVRLIIENEENPWAYLDQSVFKPFLESNPKNLIKLENELKCDDCRNDWLIQNKHLLMQISNLECDNGLFFDDPGNFGGCSSI